MRILFSTFIHSKTVLGPTEVRNVSGGLNNKYDGDGVICKSNVEVSSIYVECALYK